MIERERNPDFSAGKVTLLALSTAAASNPTDVAEHVRIAPAPEVLSLDGAATALAAMPKPLVCRASYEEDVLVISCTPLEHADEIDRRIYDMHHNINEDTGGFMSYLPDRYGDGDHLVAAFGYGKTLVFPASVAERWSRDYLIRGCGMTGDDVQNPFAADDPLHREAASLGAKGILRFRSPAEDRGKITIDVLELPLGDDATPQEKVHAEEFLIRRAQFELRVLEADFASDRVPEGRNARFRAWVEKVERERHLRLKSHFVPEMEAFYSGREMPEEISALIAACRRLL